MVRSLLFFALCLAAAFGSVSSQAATLPGDVPLTDKPALGLTLDGRSGSAGSIQLAQSTDTERRGPRTLGATPDAVQVPSLQCLSTADAAVILRDRNLRLGQVHRRPSNACPDGGVIAQSPPRGKTVRPGTTIEVVVTTNSSNNTAPTNNPPPITSRTAPAPGAVVPELSGLTPAEAQSLLRREGLDVGQVRRESAAAPLGTIIAQSITPGSRAPTGSRINVTVASEVRVPDLRTLSQADATRTLEESSLSLGRVTEESSSQPNGTIIKQWPLPGVPAAASDRVDITVAKGQTVPDLRTLSLNDARARLRDAGLRPGQVQSRVSDQRRGTIIEQRPAANQVVSPGVVVDVTLAATPIVPDLAGKTVDEARRLIAAQLLKVGTIGSRVSNAAQGTVIEQQPRADAEASPGSTVNLVLAEGLEVPNLVGLSLEEAGAALATKLMRLGDVERRATPGGDGRIIGQSPAAGSPATLGVGIAVVISETPTIPDLAGLTPDAVAERLAESQLTLADIRYKLAFDQPDQTVMDQDPPAGSAVPEGGAVTVTLAVTSPPSDRPDLVPVPRVTDLTAAQAGEAVSDLGLVLQINGSADESRPNRVVTQSPAAGQLIKIGSPVVAQLESIDEVTVPDLLGVVQDTVGTRLSEAFLELGQQDWRLSTQPDGTVIGQDPPAGTPVAFGNVVNVVLSASALVPDLTGYTIEQANPILTSQSLQLGSVQEIFSLRWPGTIVDQTPAPDSPARLDTIVEVNVVGLTGPLTAGGTLLLAVAGLVWFRTRQSGGYATAGTTPTPPPVYGISKKSAPARPAFDKTNRAAARPAGAAQSRQATYVVQADLGTQVTQTDAPSLVKSVIRVRGRTDPGEQTLAIESS